MTTPLPVSDIENNLDKNTNESCCGREFCCMRFVILFICGLFMLPFGITSVYYAYTDKSCVYIKPGKLYINLHDYLAVDGIMLLLYYVIIIVVVLYPNNNMEEDIELKESYATKLIFTINKGFTLSWNILGGIMFWKLIDNNKCNDNIYNYLYASLIIKYIFHLFELLRYKLQ